MFKFLFGDRGVGGAKAVRETQRQTFERALAEVNEIIDGLADKPKVTVDPASGHITFATPSQFPDEALALPGPSRVAEPTAPKVAPPKANPPAPDAPKPKRPQPRIPEPRVPEPKVGTKGKAD